MSVQVLRFRFPGLSVAVSVERSRRQRKERPPSNKIAKLGCGRPSRRFHSVAEIEPSLIKLQI